MEKKSFDLSDSLEWSLREPEDSKDLTTRSIAYILFYDSYESLLFNFHQRWNFSPSSNYGLSLGWIWQGTGYQLFLMMPPGLACWISAFPAFHLFKACTDDFEDDFEESSEILLFRARDCSPEVLSMSCYKPLFL